MVNFHGAGKRRAFFEGWYLKHQCGGRTLALIPAFHVDAAGISSGSLQVITDDRAWTVAFPAEDFIAQEHCFAVRLGRNHFSDQGLSLDLETEGLTLSGTLHYGPFTPLSTDIMGPFRLLGAMQCNHGVLSMTHRVEGTLTLNGVVWDFCGGTGYVEKDWGRSFPRAYLWTQCCWRERTENSLMVAVAEVPFGVAHFTGCLCAIWYGGREFRLATYGGVRLLGFSHRETCLRQGKYRLELQLLEEKPLSLQAPSQGGMTRVIRESPSCRVRYRFFSGEELLFDHRDNQAGYESSGL